MSADIELDHVTIRFGEFTAVKNVALKINGGEFFSILGPSGCGKTTLLRTISGFLDPTEGAVRIGGKDMTGIGSNKRPTALIFQNLALFPLMSVAENIAYGLRVRGIGKAERRKKAEELLALVALPGQADKAIGELSGGQKQRVAIARALAVEPQVLLLDEPLSALDLRLRQHMRAELRAIQKRVGITFIYITHDQGEALTMSDRVAVMNHGVVEQVGDGRGVYDDPATPFVASFVGENNGFEGTTDRARAGGPQGRRQGHPVHSTGGDPHRRCRLHPRPHGAGHRLGFRRQCHTYRAALRRWPRRDDDAGPQRRRAYAACWRPRRRRFRAERSDRHAPADEGVSR